MTPVVKYLLRNRSKLLNKEEQGMGGGTDDLSERTSVWTNNADQPRHI